MGTRHDRSSEMLAPPPPLQAGPAQETDVLSDVLRSVRLTGALFFRVEASSPWGEAIPSAARFAATVLPGAQHVVSYHIITRGACWARVRDGPALRLQTGDVFVVPHGDPYVMSSTPGQRPEASADAVLGFLRAMAAGSAPSLVTEGGGGPERTDLVCGFLGCDLRPFNPVLENLPRVVHLPRSGPSPGRLEQLIAFALVESAERRAGARCVLLRLSEMLFVEVVRRYLERPGAAPSGWLGGLRDPVVGRALALLHERPAHRWTLERLARETGVSRSVLADRFTEWVGKPPMRYLAHWRMQLGARLLSDGAAKVSSIATEVGYDSEAAFSRAFKKIVGTAPASWRRRSRS
jgi:AraC-like DNA-binding protein